MTNETFALFETAIGCGAIAWSGRGVTGVLLPEPDAAAARRGAIRRFPRAREGSPPAAIQRAIEGIAALLRGEQADLAFVALDIERVPPFDRRVYEVARTIPPGATLSYGAIAKRLGDPSLARDVGQALSRNPFAIVVPCHRVLAHGGRLGGFSARGGVATKLRLLAIEGAEVAGARSLFEIADAAPR